MAELSLFWDGSTVGDCGPYADNQLMDTYFRALLAGTGNEGVLALWRNTLTYSFPAANTVRVASGGAIVYGGWYESDANVDINVPNGPRTDLIVVRRDWGTQTTRLARIAGPGAAVTQTPGVTYEIPLYTVDVDGIGAVVLNTDLRDYCEFSTDPPVDSIFWTNIQDGAVTWAKQVNHPRWLTFGAGAFKADGTNPAAWVANTAPAGLPSCGGAGTSYILERDMWEFSDGATDAVWFTFRVPEDLTGAGAAPYPMEIFIWIARLWNIATGSTGDQRWVWNLYGAAGGAALANQTATTIIAEDDQCLTIWRSCIRYSLGTFNATAGDIIHCQLSRTGGHGLDTSDSTAYLFMVEVNYTAAG